MLIVVHESLFGLLISTAGPLDVYVCVWLCVCLGDVTVCMCGFD